MRKIKEKMKRIDLYITNDQLAKLEIESDDTHEPIASIIRRALNQYFKPKFTIDLEQEKISLFKELKAGKLTIGELKERIDVLTQISGQEEPDGH